MNNWLNRKVPFSRTHALEDMIVAWFCCHSNITKLLEYPLHTLAFIVGGIILICFFQKNASSLIHG